ncbi:MAG TPA: hypothetical protein PKL97_01230 [Candidatus Omnitrophota bacterium]|nr:hypothetical protein [Candidatus Omnitrophota bacterium]
MQKVTIFVCLILLLVVSVIFGMKIMSLKAKLENARSESQILKMEVEKLKKDSQDVQENLKKSEAKFSAQDNMIAELSKERENFKAQISALETERDEATKALAQERIKTADLEKTVESMKKTVPLEVPGTQGDDSEDTSIPVLR